MIKKNFKFIKSDLVAYYKNNVIWQFLLPIVTAAALLGVFVLVSDVMLFGFRYYQINYLIPVAAFAVAFASPHLTAKNVLSQNVFFKNEIEYIFEDNKIICNSYNSTSTIMFSDLYRFYESKKIFALFLSQNEAFIIPKRILSKDEITGISKVLHSNVKKRKKGFIR